MILFYYPSGKDGPKKKITMESTLFLVVGKSNAKASTIFTEKQYNKTWINKHNIQ